MFHIILVEPEIPPNTGNVIRLSANTGSRLHLIHPLGFEMDDRKLRRAGLDYREWARVEEHASFEAFVACVGPSRVIAYSTRGRRRYDEITYRPGDALVFGPETRGLGSAFLGGMPAQRIARIPMVPESRSLNLSNAVSVVLYEAWRQAGFTGGG